MKLRQFRPSLRGKITAIFAAMAAIVVIGAFGMLWYTYQNDRMLDMLMKKELALYKSAQDMELALANQKGFLTYYLVDGDKKWLELLGQYRQIFKQSLEKAAAHELNPAQQRSVELISHDYEEYIANKDKVISNYQPKPTVLNISNLHERQRQDFFNLLDKCRDFSIDQWSVIQKLERDHHRRTSRLRVLAYGFSLTFLVLGGLFMLIIFRHILLPIRGLAIETGSSPQESSMDEVLSLKKSLKGMMKHYDETYDELTRSRKYLLQAERMAMVGELAAGVAHTIRNPFTSIKMRMFSLTRSLDLDDIQHEDLKVISDEIGRIDRIVQNFLEFARPPKLSMSECSLGELVTSVIKLLEYRLKAYDVEVHYTANSQLSKIRLDADRIKEALVNLITNSCEAMGRQKGRIDISESRDFDPDLGEIAVISIKDNGAGIPEDIIHKIVTPFFSTKEDGSGLGLSIVDRIVREHNGKITTVSEPGKGTQFEIILPVAGYDDEEPNTDH